MDFTINKENTDKLKELVKVSQSVADMTVLRNLYEFVVKGTSLEAIAYGNGNIISFTVDISNFIHTESTGYFYIDILQFIQAIEKVFSASGMDEVNIKIDKTRITISQGKSKITLNMLDSKEKDEYIEAEQAFDKKVKELFNGQDEGSNTLKVSAELMSFSDTVGKFITMMNRKNVSGFSVDKDQIYYSDQALTIMKKKLSYIASNKQLFISVDLFNFLSNLAKFSDYDLVYTDSGQFARLEIPELKLKALLVQPEVVAAYPTDEELANIIPDETNAFNFEIDVPTLLSKCSTFDGIFPTAIWKWKAVDFTYDNSNPTVINLYHSSDTAEVDTDLPILKATQTSPDTSVSFKITTLLMNEYISKFTEGTDGKVYVSVANISPEDGEPHGLGIHILLKDGSGNITVDLTLCKLFSDEII